MVSNFAPAFYFELLLQYSPQGLIYLFCPNLMPNPLLLTDKPLNHIEQSF